MSKQIVVVGSSNIDLIMKMDRLPQRGESVTDAEFMQTFGGKGANQAVAVAKAGGQVSFINCVGDDSYGEQVIGNLQKAGIDTRFVFTEKGVPTGTALIMVGPNGENYLGVAPSANYRLSPAHIDQVTDIITAASFIVLQCEITVETLQCVIDLAHAAGRRTMLNLAPPRSFSDDYLSKLDILVVNETEAEFLTERKVHDVETAWQAVDALLARGCRMVVLTLGANGCLAASQQDRFHIPAFAVQAVDTTAAGDVFCGTLAAALVEGQSIAQGLRFASAAAAITVTRMGAQPSIPNRVEIDQFLNSR